MDEYIDVCFDTVIKNYEILVELSLRERKYLISIDINRLLGLLKEKETYLNKITDCINQIKSKNPQETQLSKYKSKIIQISSKLLYENNINAKIAQQHLAFSSSMLSLYLSFMQVNQTYNNKASIPYKSDFSRMV